MRVLISFVIVLFLVVCAGCAKQEPAPAVDEAPAADTEPIATEDFAAGEPEGMLEGVEEAAEEVVDEAAEEVAEEADASH